MSTDHTRGEFVPEVGARVWWGEMLFAGCEAVAVFVPARGHTLALAVQRVEDIGIREPVRLCMPGGSVERGEPLRHAAVRELREEVGIDLLPERLTWLGAVEVRQPTGEPIGVAVYLAPPDLTPAWHLAEAGLEPRWHPLAELCDADRHGRFSGPARLARLASQRLRNAALAEPLDMAWVTGRVRVVAGGFSANSRLQCPSCLAIWAYRPTRCHCGRSMG